MNRVKARAAAGGTPGLLTDLVHVFDCISELFAIDTGRCGIRDQKDI